MTLAEEYIEQIKVVNWVQQCTTVPVIHIPNQRKCSPQAGARLKRMGVRAGVTDLFLPRGNLVHKALWLELKTATGRASPAQMLFMKDMRLEGYSAEVAYGAEEAIFYIKSFYGME